MILIKLFGKGARGSAGIESVFWVGRIRKDLFFLPMGSIHGGLDGLIYNLYIFLSV